MQQQDKKTVLVVEDDPNTASLIAVYLEQDGFASLIAGDGEKALGLAARHHPVLVILDVDLIFYDTTTASFTTDYEDDPDDEDISLRQFGHSKEGTWSAQVVVALAATREGIPVRSWVFPGNTTDVNTIKQIRTGSRPMSKYACWH